MSNLVERVDGQVAKIDGQVANINPILADMEAMRKKSIRPCLMWIFIIGVIPVVGLWKVCDFGIPATIVCALIILTPVSIFVCANYRSKLTEIFKNEAVPNLVTTIGRNLKGENDMDFIYNRVYDLDIEIFRQSPFIQKKNNDFCSAEDQIAGRIGSTDFSFCEARYFYEEQAEGNKNSHEIYRGFVLDACLNHTFMAYTFIVPQNTDDLELASFKEVKMGSNEFCEKFKVYSSNEAEASALLTASLQERLLKILASQYSIVGTKRLMLSCVNNRLQLFIPSTVDHFEATLFSELKIENVAKEFQLASDAISIVNDLNRTSEIIRTN